MTLISAKILICKIHEDLDKDLKSLDYVLFPHFSHISHCGPRLCYWDSFLNILAFMYFDLIWYHNYDNANISYLTAISL